MRAICVASKRKEVQLYARLYWSHVIQKLIWCRVFRSMGPEAARSPKLLLMSRLRDTEKAVTVRKGARLQDSRAAVDWALLRCPSQFSLANADVAPAAPTEQ